VLPDYLLRTQAVGSCSQQNLISSLTKIIIHLNSNTVLRERSYIEEEPLKQSKWKCKIQLVTWQH